MKWFHCWTENWPDLRNYVLFFCKLVLVIALVLVAAMGYFSVRKAFAVRRTPKPQAIFVLEGGVERLPFALELSKAHPGIGLWYSGDPRHVDVDSFISAGVPRDEIHLDDSAVDTVTNFTTTIDALHRHGITHVYLVTSDYHMLRAGMIATVVLGSRGIGFTPRPSPTSQKNDSLLRVMRDYVRSLVWVVSGYTGESFKKRHLYIPPESE